MTRTHIVVLIAVIVAAPAAAGAAFFASGAKSPFASGTKSSFAFGTKSLSDKPCFNAGQAGYEFSGSAAATHTVRIDNRAESPQLRIQVVDSPAEADFVLVDDTGAVDNACKNVAAIETIHLDPAAVNPNLTVSLSRAPADYKIYVRSAAYSERDAAALFAVIWQNANQTGSLGQLAKRD